MKRVLVVGSSGSGKSFVARALGEILGLPVVHLDLLWWKPGWAEAGEDEFDRRLADALAQERWICDGNYSRTFATRLARADTVVFLDMPRWLCIWRVLVRTGKTRPDLPENCVEHRFSRDFYEFLKWTWNYPRRSRPRVLDGLHRVWDTKTVYRLRSRGDVDRFLAGSRTAALGSSGSEQFGP